RSKLLLILNNKHNQSICPAISGANTGLFAILGIFASLVFSSCTKPGDFKLKNSPPDQSFDVQMTDTARVNMQTILYDSTITDDLGRDLIGSYNDAVFGQTRASVYTQLYLSTNSPIFPSNAKVTSVVFKMRWCGKGY